MARRTKRAVLEVRVSFEPARIALECLIQAYERVLPVQRRPTRPETRLDAHQGEAAAKRRRIGQGSDHA